jgi:hypothetical protein
MAAWAPARAERGGASREKGSVEARWASASSVRARSEWGERERARKAYRALLRWSGGEREEKERERESRRAKTSGCEAEAGEETEGKAGVRPLNAKTLATSEAASSVERCA